MRRLKQEITNCIAYYWPAQKPVMKKHLDLDMAMELSSQYLYLGTWDYINLLNRAAVHLEFSFGKFLTIYAGPAFSGFYSNQTEGIPGYLFPIPPTQYKTIKLGNEWSGWFGWNAGIHIF